MANKTRTPEMINFQKQQMSKAALEIIIKEGYNSLSIRKLSSRLNISQSTIYNYFKNRDEIYIYVLNYGFEIFYQELLTGYNSKKEPVERLRQLCKVSLSFGIRERDLAFIMLILDTPKYLDYLETDFEPIMRVELSNALKCKNIFTRVISEISESYSSVPVKDIEYQTFSVITRLIGIVTVYNNNLIKYMVDKMDSVMERFIDDIIQSFELKKKKPGK